MKKRGRDWAAAAACLLLVGGLGTVSLFVGSFPLSLSQIGSILTGGMEGTLEAQVFWQLRFPRMCMGLLAGWALGLAGGVYQTVFRNPLASPDLTGVASGASLGAACAIVLGAGTRLEIMGGSFLMGMAALALVLLLVGAARLERTGSYLLAGVIVSSLAEAGLMTLKVMADPERELAAIEVWTMGSLSAMTADKLPLPAAAVVLCTIALLLLRRPILMLSLGDEQARSLGLDPVFWRGVLLTLTTLMVAAVVSVLGAVAFVGLIAPHIARLLLGRRGGPYLPLCGLVGGRGAAVRRPARPGLYPPPEYFYRAAGGAGAGRPAVAAKGGGLWGRCLRCGTCGPDIPILWSGTFPSRWPAGSWWAFWAGTAAESPRCSGG